MKEPVHGKTADGEERRRIVEDLRTTLLVEASAGTGKTAGMVQRMTALLRGGHCRIDTMAAVTFTRKAAAELRSRFQAALETALADEDGDGGDELRKASRRVDRCFIGTIHSFCARLLRERPIEAGVDLSFRETDEREDLLLRDEAWRAYVAGLIASGDPALERLEALGLGIDALGETFVSFAEYPDVETWPLSDPGMGDLDATRGALLSYSSHMDRVARHFPGDRGNDRLMDRYEQIVRMTRNRDLLRPEVLMEVLELFHPTLQVVQKNWPGGSPAGKKEKERWVSFFGDLVHPQLARWRQVRYAAVLPLLQGARDLYDDHRRDSGVLNYQDLLMAASRLLRDRAQVRKYFARRYTHLLVDEFQDTDPIQAEVMMFLTASDHRERNWKACRPRPGSLFVVGDPKQSVYRFRRADIVTYRQVCDIITASGGDVIHLTTNFRTAGGLVKWVNGAFRDAFPKKSTPYAPSLAPMAAGRRDVEAGSLEGLRLVATSGEGTRNEEVIEEEGSFIARFIRSALDDGLTIPRTRREVLRGLGPEARPGDFMIVTWRRKNLALYGRHLRELGIPHRISGGSAFGQVRELSLLADCLKAVTEPHDPLALIGLLRGEAFGVSDAELYRYHKAGGSFSYALPLPASLEEETALLFRSAFEKLRRYASWTRRLPPLSAIERIASDLGLVERALAGPGGNELAGTIAKTFQMLRALQRDLPSAAELGAHLRQLIREGAEFDGIQSRGDGSDAVRVMNLHRAKGLEAPVVFLSDPSGKVDRDPVIHIDRRGDRSRGYLAIREKRGEYSSRLIAHHGEWEQFKSEERKFVEAERTRLLYVGATRAGSMLVVTSREKGNHRNPWDFRRASLEEGTALTDPGPRVAPPGEEIPVKGSDVSRALENIEDRWRKVLRPSYLLDAMKKTDISPSELYRTRSRGEHGTEWGTVIHFLLERALRDTRPPLEPMARRALEEQGLDPALAGEALRTVAAVMASELWKRAQSSPRFLVEVPVEITGAGEGKGDPPKILRGVIDLLFRVDGGWAVVDYKTDIVGPGNLDELADRYGPQVRGYADAWERITGEKVVEKGLFFTALNSYVTL